MGAVHFDHALDSRPFRKLYVTTQENTSRSRNGSVNLRWRVPLTHIEHSTD